MVAISTFKSNFQKLMTSSRWPNKYFKNNRKVLKRGAVIRTGDIIKLGRVPIMIKESSIDTTRFENHKDGGFARNGNHMELDVLSHDWSSP